MVFSECPICLTDTEIHNTAMLDCSHVFCIDCLLNHLTQKITCPLCRNIAKTYEYNFTIHEITSSLPPVDQSLYEYAEIQRTRYLQRAARTYLYVSYCLVIFVILFQVIVLLNILVVSYQIFYYYKIA
jgi:hypothetical protein